MDWASPSAEGLMDPDYPAAHSMDTTWFAVDRQGHVAVFSTGQLGAVAAHAPGPEDAAEAYDRLQEIGPHTTLLYDRSPAAAPHADIITIHTWWPDVRIDDDEQLLMFLPSLAPVASELTRGDCRLVRATDGVAVLWRRLSQERGDALHAARMCLHCRMHWADLYSKPGRAQMGERGVYVYDQLDCYSAAGLYARTEAPHEPLRIAELPRAAQSVVGRVRFDHLSFVEQALIQPMSHMPCVTWTPDWVGSDGKTLHHNRETGDDGDSQTAADYPAAHSMDTDWFAVDQDGHVAVFETGATGAVPTVAHLERRDELIADPFDVLAEIQRSRTTLTEPVYDLAVLGTPRLPTACGHYGQITDRRIRHSNTLMFLPTLDPVEREIDAGWARPVRASEGAAVIWRVLPAHTFARLHDGGLCRYCETRWRSLFEDQATEPAQVGLFHYDQPVYWCATAYYRDSSPLQPLHVSELGDSVCALVERMRFLEIRFQETPYIQPLELVPCYMWGPEWLASDGQTVCGANEAKDGSADGR
jgi:hypothetical protein